MRLTKHPPAERRFVNGERDPLHPAEKRWFLLTGRGRDSRAGLTLIELIVAFTILLILSTMALPMARVRVQREKERRLRDALTEMRKAIDRYKDYADAGKLGQIDPDTHGYPESLDVLVEGVEISDNGAGMGMPGMGGFGNMPGAGGIGQPAGQGNRSGRGSFGSSRGGFGSNRGGSGGSSFGQSNRGSSSRGSFGSSRGNTGSSQGGIGGTGRLGREGAVSDDDEPQKIRFLRRIPVDPITGNTDWGMRSVQDSPDSMSWGGRNVFDVFSKSMDTALDGTRYSEW